MDWANTLKNIKDIELGIHCSLFLFGLIIILSGIYFTFKLKGIQFSVHSSTSSSSE
mgnify:CR=1 FL=1